MFLESKKPPWRSLHTALTSLLFLVTATRERHGVR
jgi:hypothetical protein